MTDDGDVRASAPSRERARLAALCGSLSAASLPALLAPGTMRAAAAAAPPDVAVPAATSLAGALLAYAVAPVVALSACVLFLAPGLVLAHLVGRGRDATTWLVSAFALSLAIVSLVAGVGQGIAGAAWRGAPFGWMLLLVTAVLAAAGSRRAGAARAWVLDAPHARWTLAGCAVAVLALGALLAPKLHWESFNGDGAHAFEAARLLLVRAVPLWDPAAGALAGFPGLTSAVFAFPASWFLRLFGEVDAAARLPFLLAIPLLFAAIVAAAQAGRATLLDRADLALVWLALAPFALAMAFSATYSPYTADLALPGPQDALFMVAMLAWVAAFANRERGWIIAFLALTWLSLPSGFLLAVFWMIAAALVMRPLPAAALRWSAIALLGCMLAGALVPRVLVALSLPEPGREYGLAGLLRYFAVLQATELRRVAWVAIACGIAPVAAMFAWQRQDGVARALTLCAGAYFAFFYVQANVSLHHFVPAMCIAPVVWARVVAAAPAPSRRGWRVAAAVAGAVALLLAWPPSLQARAESRLVGRAVELGIGGYGHSAPEPYAAARLLLRLFPEDWDPRVPARYGGSEAAWLRYAATADNAGSAAYVLQPAALADPLGARLEADSAGWRLWVRDEARLAEHRALRPPTPAGSRWLAVPRWTLFRSVERPAGLPPVLDVADALERRGVDVDAILRRIGVRR